MKVLLVEDDILIRIFVKRGLKKNGCEEVSETETGEEALDLVKSEEPDVVFIDIKLKGDIDGVEIARRIKREREEDTTLVYMSAYDQEVFDIQEINFLFDHHLSKPVNAEELADLCKKLNR